MRIRMCVRACVRARVCVLVGWPAIVGKERHVGIKDSLSNGHETVELASSTVRSGPWQIKTNLVGPEMEDAESLAIWRRGDFWTRKKPYLAACLRWRGGTHLVRARGLEHLNRKKIGGYRAPQVITQMKPKGGLWRPLKPQQPPT